MHIYVAKSASADTRAAWERWDSNFHRALGLASWNTMLADLIDLINTSRRQARGAIYRDRQDAEQWKDKWVDQHRAIIRAIAARDPQAAAKAMRAHLKSVEDQMFGNVDDLAELTERL